jgi:4-amino-4-deoxy-L-arabinose transferase-like glycosyltransferase
MKNKPKDFTKQKYYIIILIVILLLGAFLRFYNITKKGFYFDDEAIYALQAKSKLALPQAAYHHFKDDISFKEARELYMPWGFWKGSNGRPGYISLAAFSFFVGGEKDYVIFILNGFLSLLAVFFLYLLASLMTNKKIGLIAAFLLAISPYFLYYSRNGRSQAATSLFLIAGIYFFAKALKDKKNNSRLFFISGILIGYAFTTHWSLLVSIIVIPLIFLYFWHKKTFPYEELKKYFFRFSAGFLIPLLFFQIITAAQDALLYYFIPYTQNFANYFAELLDLFRDIPRAKIYGSFEPLFYLNLFSLMDGIMPLILLIAGIILIIYKKLYKNSEFLPLLAVTTISIILISVSYTRVARTFATFLPLVYFFAAFAIWETANFINNKKLQIIFVASIILLISLSAAKNNPRLLEFGNPYKKAVEIAQRHAPNDKIFLAEHVSSPIFYFYANDILKGAYTSELAKKQGAEIFLSDWLLWEDVASDRKYFLNLAPSITIDDPFLEMLINPLEVDRWVSYYGSGIEDFLELKTEPYFNAINIYKL